MMLFIRLLGENDKANGMQSACELFRTGQADDRFFELGSEAFDDVPGKPFAYWVSKAIRSLFKKLLPFESEGRTVRQGLATADDFRFVRGWWEVGADNSRWPGYAKGGAFSPFYSDVYLVVKWADNGAEIRNFFNPKTGKLNSRPQNLDFFRRPGFTYTSYTNLGFAPRVMQADCVFSIAGMGIHGVDLADLAFLNSDAFQRLLYLTADHRKWEAGVVQRTPIPVFPTRQREYLAQLARRAWSLKRNLDTVEETSHAFILPLALRSRHGDYDPPAIEEELRLIQAEIDTIAFDLYNFSEADRAVMDQPMDVDANHNIEEDGECEDDSDAFPADTQSALFSWAVGVAFGRFDWRFASGERNSPPEPDPFDPLPVKSPGMLPDDATPFHLHDGVLVDDRGHIHDLAQLVEEVLTCVHINVPDNVRRWLQREFFMFHLRLYSKSRRKAPIFWPLSSNSGSYTLWVYYPSLTSQTLYIAINDFIEPKLGQVGTDVSTLRNKGAARSRDDEKQFEVLQAFELELIELRDTLLKLAPTYKPNHDDGVQISAAPLWPLFRHKPWQKVLKDTWAKLQKGDYDWAHLAMNYWPERVREKCKVDKSLAIAHGLEHLYIEPKAKPKKTRGRKKAGGDE
jgi:hypothetical protein